MLNGSQMPACLWQGALNLLLYLVGIINLSKTDTINADAELVCHIRHTKQGLLLSTVI